MASADQDEILPTGFPDAILGRDHYNGVTLQLDKCSEQQKKLLLDPESFKARLTASLEEWKSQGKKGIWIHCPLQHAELIPIATALDFEFHMVHKKRTLILSRWLPDSLSKLPLGPTHQVGVGCLIFCPWDRSQMLVVQEKTGPAAAYDLWKMPTGLSDPGEDVHQAAQRELREETGLQATFQGILVFRQAHGSLRSGVRSSSDLFFVCQMQLDDAITADNCENLFQACPDEIAAIRWMSVEEYCNQERWKTSPVYLELNKAILEASKQEQTLFHQRTLSLGFGTPDAMTNAIYLNRKSNL